MATAGGTSPDCPHSHHFWSFYEASIKQSEVRKNGAAPTPEKLPPGSRAKVKRAQRIVKALEANPAPVVIPALSPPVCRAEYERIEEALEELLVKAEALDNHSLFIDLRNARRRASAAILG